MGLRELEFQVKLSGQVSVDGVLLIELQEKLSPKIEGFRV